MKKRALFTLLMVAAVSSYASSTEVVIFSDDFSGGAATNLNGQAPDVRPGGETWVAVSSPSYFKADGSFVGGGTGGTRGGSATLAFTPEDGRVYTLDASVTGVTGDGNWIGFGFAQGQSTAGSVNDRFVQGNVIGKAWMLLKGDATGSENSALMNGTASNEPWATYTQENPGGDMLMRIVLDTMGGAGNWSATWYAKRPADPDYAIILATTNLLDETISSVGFAVSGPTVSGSIESFSLIVPAGDVRGPYTADANTLHLWHMDESNPGPAAPASGVTDSFNLTPGGGAMLGNLAYAGFGTGGVSGQVDYDDGGAFGAAAFAEMPDYFAETPVYMGGAFNMDQLGEPCAAGWQEVRSCGVRLHIHPVGWRGQWSALGPTVCPNYVSLSFLYEYDISDPRTGNWDNFAEIATVESYDMTCEAAFCNFTGLEMLDNRAQLVADMTNMVSGPLHDRGIFFFFMFSPVYSGEIVSRTPDLLADDYWIQVAQDCQADGIGLDFPPGYWASATWRNNLLAFIADAKQYGFPVLLAASIRNATDVNDLKTYCAGLAANNALPDAWNINMWHSDGGPLTPETNPDDSEAGSMTGAALWLYRNGYASNAIPDAGVQPVNPSPADMSIGVSPSTILSWATNACTVEKQVYFGTNASEVANATTADLQYKGATAGTTFAPGPLTHSTAYFWRVDDIGPEGVFSKGDVLQFTTIYGLPFAETFEASDPSMAGTLGPLDGQHGWKGSPSDSAEVQNTEYYGGAQACSAAYAEVSQAFTNDGDRVSLTFRLKPTFMNDVVPPAPDCAAMFWVNQDGHLTAYDGLEINTSTAVTLTEGTWVYFEVLLDYAAQQWSLSANGTNVIERYAFHDPHAALNTLLFQSGRACHVDDIDVREYSSQSTLIIVK